MAASVNLDISKRVDIICKKGDTFSIQLTFSDENGEDMNIEGHEFKMSVSLKTAVSSQEVISYDSFVYTVSPSNVVTIVAQHTTMSGVDAGNYVYDLQSLYQETVRTWIYGVFKVNDDISIT